MNNEMAIMKKECDELRSRIDHLETTLYYTQRSGVAYREDIKELEKVAYAALDYYESESPVLVYAPETPKLNALYRAVEHWKEINK